MCYHVSMLSASLIVEARRRAGLSQRALAQRVGIAQPGIARLESGREQPSLERVRAIVAACGLELTVGLAAADRSYDAQIRAALASAPARRLRLALAAADNSRAARAQLRGGQSPAPADVPMALDLLETHEVAYVLIGEIAEVLHGSPIMPTAGVVTIVARPGDGERLQRAIANGGGRQLEALPATSLVEGATRWQLEACGVELRVEPVPAGTRGYEDLRRDAARVDLGVLSVAIASLLDLVRIAEASTDVATHARVAALRRTLELTNEPDEEIARAA